MPVAMIAILCEAEHLNDINDRPDLIADQHPQVEEARHNNRGNIRGTATLMEILVATTTSTIVGVA